MKQTRIAILASALGLIVGCQKEDTNRRLAAPNSQPEISAPGNARSTSASNVPASNDTGDVAATAEEIAPMRPEFIAELAKIHEPPEMAQKPMKVRNWISPELANLSNLLNAVHAPEKATHEQRTQLLSKILDVAKGMPEGDARILYAGAAGIACIDGADPQIVISYANGGIAESYDALALRARMYLAAGDRNKSLDDLEHIMRDGGDRALTGGKADPQQKSEPCGWSITDFDALGDDARAKAAKAFYFSSFIAFGAEEKKTVNEAEIRQLYSEAARRWVSPIPYYLSAKLNGLGSEHSLAGAGCLRASIALVVIPKNVEQCAAYDVGTLRDIRELTMALVVDPKFGPALGERAERYLQLGQSYYADRKPSRHLFELAIADYTAALSLDGANRSTLYCDRGLSFALIGLYKEAADDYVQGIRFVKDGVETDPFVYQQLARLHMKLGNYSEAVEVTTQSIMNSSGAGIETVIFSGGLTGFRILYPEYDALPDEILADVIRRRYEPQFSQTWNTTFISKRGIFGGNKIPSSVLPETYILRGDAYLKVGRPSEAQSDYSRVKSDAWEGEEPYLPRQMYFSNRGARNLERPEPWPPPPPRN